MVSWLFSLPLTFTCLLCNLFPILYDSSLLTGIQEFYLSLYLAVNNEWIKINLTSLALVYALGYLFRDFLVFCGFLSETIWGNEFYV